MKNQTNLPVIKAGGYRNVIMISALLLFLIFAGLFIRTDFISFKDTIITQNQQESLDTARTAARGIETYLRNIGNDLHLFSKNEVHGGSASLDAFHNELLKNFRGSNFQRKVQANGSEMNYRLESLGLVNAEGIMNVNVIDGPVFRNHFIKEDYLNSDNELKRRLFEVPKTTGKLFLSDIDKNSEGYRFWMSYPIHYRNQTFKGVVIAGLDPREVFERFITPIQSGMTRYAWVVDSSGTVLTHPRSELIGKNISEIIDNDGSLETHREILSRFLDKMNRGYQGVETYPSIFRNNINSDSPKELTAFSPAHVGNQLWTVGVSMDYTEIYEPIYQHSKNMSVIACLFILLAGTVGYGYYRKQKKEALFKAEAENLKLLAKTAEALKESEEKYQTLFEHAGFGITLFDIETGERLEFNRMAYESLGYTRDEFKLLTAGDLDAFHTPNEVKKQMSEILKQGSTVFETMHKAKNGELRHGLISSVPFCFDGKNYMQSIRLDITDRKKAELALKESEERFQRLVDYTPDALYLHDLDGGIIDVNLLACESLGYTKEELLTMNIQDIEQNFISGKHAERWRQMSPNVPATIESVQKRKDGSTFPVEIRIWIFESGENQHMLALVRDITERKIAEKEKRKLEAQLAHSKKMQSIGTLAGGIAHNFNNLLMGIQGNASLIQFNKKPDDPDFNRLSIIHKLVDSGSRLTGQLLGYAREGRYEVKPLNFNQLVKETADTFSSTRKLTLHQDLSEDLYGVKADKGQIDQALLNLYLNAADSMPNGVDIFLSTRNVTHRDMLDKSYNPVPGNYVLLTVRDTGTGIDVEIKDRIFEPFFTTKGLANGTGLGLASVYGIIKGHRGYIDVISQKSLGTSFQIYLPATKEKKREDKTASDYILKGEETILLVDDESIIIDTGRQMLEFLGYNVLTATGGKEAVKLYKEYSDKIDMLLLDMVMPDMNGGDTYDRIKEINPQVRTLLSSGYSIDGEAKVILKRGCNGFIQKPFSINKLSSSIRDILDRPE